MKRQAFESKGGFKQQNFTRGKYYLVKSISMDLYLTIDKNLSQQNPSFDKQNNFDLQQIWMLQEVAPQTYQIIHPFSAMALEIVQNSIKLRPNKLKNSQTFYIDKSDSNLSRENSNVYIFKEFKHSKKYIFPQFNELKCQQRPLFKDQSNKWTIQIINSHPLIKETFLIENINSGLIISIHQSKATQGQTIVQNLMANLFCQRWQFIKKNEYFAIKSLKSGFVLDIKQEKIKQGNNVIQWKFQDSLNQLWILQEHGKRMYLIRSALNQEFVLGIKANSFKDEAQLIITKNQSQSFWRIVGPINF